MPYVRAEQEKRAATAQRQLEQLGKVNPLALEEFAALEERHAFLATQLEALKKTPVSEPVTTTTTVTTTPAG